MNRYVKGRGRGARRIGDPGVPEVEKVELSEKHLKLRLVIAVLALLIGALLMVRGFMKMLGRDSGWQEITILSSADMNCGDQFTLNYNIGSAGVAAGTEYRSIQSVYTDACVKAYEIYNADEQIDGVVNLFELNNHPNTVYTVDPALYQTLEMLEESGSRLLYYGPLYETMDNIYNAETDQQAKEVDPVYDSATADDFDQVLSYANDPAAISLDLLGDNQVRLTISENYLAFGEEYGIERYIDLYLMKNAFICDYLADQLIEAGYTLGTISSYDGYSRCLDGGEGGSVFSLYDRVFLDEEDREAADESAGEDGNTVIAAATVSVPDLDTIVSLKDFPLQSGDAYRYYIYEDGQIRSPYLGEDGRCHAAMTDLIACADNGSCAETLLALLPVYIADSIDRGAIRELAEEKGIYTIYCQDRKILTNVPGAEFSEVYARDDMEYTVETN